MGAKWRNATHGDALPVGLKSAGEMSNAKDCGGAVTWETFPRRSAGIEGSVRNQPPRHGGSREGRSLTAGEDRVPHKVRHAHMLLHMRWK